MHVEFYKYQGTGNDFIILDNRQGLYSNLHFDQIYRLCNRRFGIGADGLMLFDLKEGYDFEMKYFNSDGKPGSMCGNGGRCMIRFAYDMGIIKYTYKFLASDGPHEGEIERTNLIRLKMNDVDHIEDHKLYQLLNTGSPHYIKQVQNVSKENVKEEGRKIRNQKTFEKEGINVNFVEISGDDSIKVRTYERGVEDETLSCGTGVTAAALVTAHNAKGFNRVKVETPGGLLSVEFTKANEQLFENIWLVGPAEMVFKGEADL